MANNKAIQILRGSKTFDPSKSDEILLDGQLFYSKKTKQLYIGDGLTSMNNSETIVTPAGTKLTKLKFKPIGASNLMPGDGKHSVVQVPYLYEENEDGSLNYENKALGSDSIALGINCVAEGSRSVAWGNGCKSFGNTAMAFGQVNTCYSNCSFISGNANECGKSTDAQNGSYALVGGRLNKNFGQYSLISGYMNENNANYSNISGYDNKILSDQAKSLLICGISNKIDGVTYNSLIISQESEVTNGAATVTTGTKNKILGGQNIFIEGSNNVASGVNVHAAGRGNNIKGNVLSVGGVMNNVQANNSCIFGSTNNIGDDETILDNVIAFGKSLRAVESDKFIIGKFNKPKTGTIFEIGNGIAANNVDSGNAFEVYLDGRAKVYGEPKEDNDVLRWQEKLKLDENLGIEKARAEDAENRLNSKIEQEIRHREAACTQLQENITAETIRAKKVEGNLDKLNVHIGTVPSEEEIDLVTAINNVYNKVVSVTDDILDQPLYHENKIYGNLRHGGIPKEFISTEGGQTINGNLTLSGGGNTLSAQIIKASQQVYIGDSTIVSGKASKTFQLPQSYGGELINVNYVPTTRITYTDNEYFTYYSKNSENKKSIEVVSPSVISFSNFTITSTTTDRSIRVCNNLVISEPEIQLDNYKNIVFSGEFKLVYWYLNEDKNIVLDLAIFSYSINNSYKDGFFTETLKLTKKSGGNTISIQSMGCDIKFYG